jgi:RimJ/RimL family protein N-acetyltransferase
MKKIYQLQVIETPRLLIRPLKIGDEFEIDQAIDRSQATLARWMPWAQASNFEKTREFVTENVKGWQTQTLSNFPMAVILKTDNKIIAVSGFNEKSNLKTPYFEIRYWIDTEREGQGYVTQIVIALTRFALQYLKATRVQICVPTENKPSIAVAKRCGFIEEATLKNHSVDGVSNETMDSLIFACFKVATLPAQEVSWQCHQPI